MTAATVTTAPGPDQGPGATPRVDFDRWERQLADPDTCTHPIQLRGRIDAIDLATGELARVYDTTGEPGGVVHVPCGNRREAVCPACSQVYKRDARQLVRAGLAGGKGIPDTITAHPCVFATLTAPSFGPVHSRRMRGKTVLPCRPRRDAKARRCPHGHDCPARLATSRRPAARPPHVRRLLRLRHRRPVQRPRGRAVAPVHTHLPRYLARLCGLTLKALHAEVRIRYVKVAEYQARGVVHFHAVIRLDAATTDGTYQPPPGWYTAALLADAIGQAVAAVRIYADSGTPRPVMLRFGAQTDARPIHRETVVSPGRPLDGQAVANYIAKYATKTLTAPGLPNVRIRHQIDIDHLRCSLHYRAMITAAWRLGSRQATAIRGSASGRTCSATAATS